MIPGSSRLQTPAAARLLKGSLLRVSEETERSRRSTCGGDSAECEVGRLKEVVLRESARA